MNYSVVITAIAKDNTSFTLSDRSPWSLGPNPARNQRALVLFVTRTDKDGVRTPLNITPDVINALTVANWDINISDDGWIEKILFSIKLWNSGQAYVIGDIIYNAADQTFYKCTTGHTNHIPPNLTYWTSLGNGIQNPSSLYTSEIANASTQMEVVIMDDLFTGRIELKIEQEFERSSDGSIDSTEKGRGFNEAYEITAQLAGAYSALDNDRPSEAEEQVRSITNYTLRYGTP